MSLTLAVTASAQTKKVSFSNDVTPILAQCMQCHGQEPPASGLSLKTREGVFKGGLHGPAITAGDAAASHLYMRLMGIEQPRMPLGGRLTDQQIAIIKDWIDGGAEWDPQSALAAFGSSESSTTFTEQQRRYWALQKVVRPAIPAVKQRSWARNPIDNFILARLEKKNLKPNPPADKITLLRRVYFDLIGLPPAPEQAEAFLDDHSEDAYEKVVDQLLASPQYGERWGRHWLDLARYAESYGFSRDEVRPNAWRYRDYVVKAFNDDKPYDRFIREQIAGDELWPDDPDARVATAFMRHYPEEKNEPNLIQQRQQILDDITDTTSAVFLGLTVACARCHNHKYDPILQKDYFRLEAFFANTGSDDRLDLRPPDRVREDSAKTAAWEEKTRDIQTQIHALAEPGRRRAHTLDGPLHFYTEDLQAVLLKPAPERTDPFERVLYHQVRDLIDPDDEVLLSTARGKDRDAYQKLSAQLEKFSEFRPPDVPRGAGMIDLGRNAPPVYLGGYEGSKTIEVQPGFLSILDPKPATIVPPQSVEVTGRRTALANWLGDPSNPLTHRVMVNRIWFHHFGEGIVATPSDFGMMGARPTHPELLDWLTTEFIRSGFSIKQMHRLIVTSGTYRQSSAYRAEAAKVDDQNSLLWHFPRQRLEGEVVRDSALFTAGLLDLRVGGPSVFPRLPEDVNQKGDAWWKPSTKPEDQNRRSVYIFARRNLRYPMLEVMDLPDTNESCGRRQVTTIAPQALTFLNSDLILEWAEAFAGQVLRVAGTDQSAQIEYAYRRAYSRKPNGAEKDAVLTFFKDQSAILSERLAAGEKLAKPAFLPEGVSGARGAALVDFCHMLLDSNEFLYRN